MRHVLAPAKLLHAAQDAPVAHPSDDRYKNTEQGDDACHIPAEGEVGADEEVNTEQKCGNEQEYNRGTKPHTPPESSDQVGCSARQSGVRILRSGLNGLRLGPVRR